MQLCLLQFTLCSDQLSPSNYSLLRWGEHAAGNAPVWQDLQHNLEHYMAVLLHACTSPVPAVAYRQVHGSDGELLHGKVHQSVQLRKRLK